MHEPSGALGLPLPSNHHVLQPVEPGPRMESTVDLPPVARRALQTLAEADLAVALQTQIDMANFQERQASLGMEERTPATSSSAAPEVPLSGQPPENPLPDGTHFV